LQLARSRGYDAIWINDRVERFRDHCLSNGRAFDDIDAAWRNCGRKAMDLDDDPLIRQRQDDDRSARCGGFINPRRFHRSVPKARRAVQGERRIFQDWPRVHGLPPQHPATRVPRKIREEFGFA
jgi:hypothetical protein